MRRFDQTELHGAEQEPSSAELAEAVLAACRLESLTATVVIRPTEGFEDRVMAAIATEPAPRLMVRPGSSVRGGRPAAFLLAIRDAWGVATHGGRPIGVRAQALAFVLLVVVAAGTLTGAAAIGVGGLLRSPQSPAPSSEPSPSNAPSPSGTPDASETPHSDDPGGSSGG